MTSGIDLGHS